MKIKKIRNMNDEELKKQLQEFKVEFCNLRCELGLGKLTNTAKIKHVKQNIAQIYTIITERSLLKQNIRSDIFDKDNDNKDKNTNAELILTEK